MMRKSIFTFLLVAMAFVSKAQDQSTDKGVTMLKTFYTAYLSVSSAEDDNMEAMEVKLSALRRRYCTPACQKQFKVLVRQTDADPIIKAQDSYKELIKTLAIEKDSKKPGRYAVSYTNTEGDREKITIYVTLATQNNALKISYLE